MVSEGWEEGAAFEMLMAEVEAEGCSSLEKETFGFEGEGRPDEEGGESGSSRVEIEVKGLGRATRARW